MSASPSVRPSVLMFQIENRYIDFDSDGGPYRTCKAILIFINIGIIEVCFCQGISPKEQTWKLCMRISLSTLVLYLNVSPRLVPSEALKVQHGKLDISVIH